jgi:preprotein translocase SecE subunit
MKAYKPEQGRMARMATFWVLAFLILFGCTTLHTVLIGNIDKLAEPLFGGARIPVITVEVTGAFLLTTVLCLGGITLLYFYMQRPKVADLLIGTESELRKVTWPTMDEVINSSVVVVICVLLLMGFLAGADWSLGRIMAFLLLGEV